MKRALLKIILLGATLMHGSSMATDTGEFSFAVISPLPGAAMDDDALRDAIAETDEDNLAFVIANGMKSANEPCTDKLYLRRKALLEEAKNGLIVSLAASDWAECKNEAGKSAANGKLNRVRELFFSDEFSMGASRIPVIRQSMTAKYRSFSENARWEMGRTMFATLNLPASNNHFIFDAGRNSEFEDRLIANRHWLQRIFSAAMQKKNAAIVLFCDGNPLAIPRAVKRDGYAEIRSQIKSLAKKFPGKVLIVHGEAAKTPSSPAIIWNGNLGQLGAGASWIKVTVARTGSTLFVVANHSGQIANKHR